MNEKVFIVHGHDDEAKVTVARFVEKLGLGALILDEQPSEGLTIIEKFESVAREAEFAIGLMTPDDLARSKDEADVQLRARQNVLIEIGYFLALLGRKRVCILYKEGTEIPSDFQGIIYIPMDRFDGWQLKLAREMRAAGLSFDLNRLL